MATIIIDIDTDREEDVLDLAEAVRHVARLVTFQTIVRSRMETLSAHDAAERTAYENYGPEGDIEVFRDAEALAAFGDGDVTTRDLIAAALDAGHLDADGILAMMRGAAERVL